MCGIIGGNLYNKQTLQQGLQKTIHRGRDNQSWDNIDDLYFGHNRLAIQDLSDRANQPFWNKEKTVCVVYNGQLWDSKTTKQLKEKITIPFRTTSDTEILLNAYLEFGLNCIDELDGMFCFAIIDTRINQLFLVRDAFGELPLYYYVDKITNKIAFCSELKGLPLSEIYKKQVKLLDAGHFVQYNYKTLEHKLTQWYRLPSEIINHSRETIISNIRKDLEQAVKVKMISDVPICTILSGGLDSVIVTYLLSKIKPNIEAFVVSMGEGDTKNDDIKYARMAAKEFGVKLHEIILTEEDIINSIKEAVYVIESDRWVNIGPSIAQIALAKKIDELGFKVVFSGDMADEVFGSYGHIQAFHYTQERFDLARRKEIKMIGKTNFICTSKSMMWGGTVEIRAPFAWKPFVEYHVNVPPLYRIEEGNTKPLLREAFKGEISDEILFRPKVPFHKGARTTDLTKPIKEELKEILDNTFVYKDIINQNKFFYV